MTVFRQAPTYTMPLITKNNTSMSWYRWVQNIDKGLPPSGEMTVTATPSPYIYTAVSKGFVIITGGTVTSIQFSRTPGIFYDTGQSAGSFPVSQNDQIKIVYSAAPSIIFVPQ